MCLVEQGLSWGVLGFSLKSLAYWEWRTIMEDNYSRCMWKACVMNKSVNRSTIESGCGCRFGSWHAYGSCLSLWLLGFTCIEVKHCIQDKNQRKREQQFIPIKQFILIILCNNEYYIQFCAMEPVTLPYKLYAKKEAYTLWGVKLGHSLWGWEEVVELGHFYHAKTIHLVYIHCQRTKDPNLVTRSQRKETQ